MREEGEETHKAKRKDAESAHRMRPHPRPKNPQMPRRHHQIPQEVPRRQALNHPTTPRIAIHALHRPHSLALLIHRHDPQRRGIDAAALDQRDDVHVPVEAGARVEGRVDGGEEVVGEPGGEERLDGLVEEEGEGDLVDVVGQGGEGEEVGERGGEGGEEGGRGGEGVEHGGK